MAFALVGSAGAATQGAVGVAVTPAYGQSPTAGNLLLMFVTTTGGTTLPSSIISGWTLVQQTGTTFSVTASIYRRFATGGDAAPTVAALTSTIITAHLEEWSGGVASPTSPTDKVGAGNTSTSPNTVTLNAADTQAGELVAMAAADFRSAARTPSDTWTSNNGTPVLRASNNGVSSASHYSHATMVTTGNASADTAVLTASVTTSLTGLAVVAVSFKLGATPTFQEAAAAITALATVAAADADVRSAVPYNRRNRMQELVAQ